MYGSISVWFYDTGADVPSSNYLELSIHDMSLGGWIAYLGTRDYDLGPGDGGEYRYGSRTGWEWTTIDRTQAWHHLEIDLLPNSTT